MAHLDSEHRAEVVSAGAMLRELAETQRNPAPGQGQEPAGPDTSHEPSCTVPVLRWHTLRPDRYRAALKAGELECGIYVGEQWHRGKPTVVFIHGAAGAPSQFADLARLLGPTNCAAFLWDDKARLAPTAEVLRGALLRLPGRVTIVAYSMGALLPAYLGATDRRGRLRSLAAVYLNPLIGGSRYAGDFRVLRWLRVGPALQRVFFPPSFLDLAPEGDFQQAICGRSGARSSFVAHTVLLFTEKRGKEPDIRPARVPHYFGRTRQELLDRFGSVVAVPPLHAYGHAAPLLEPNLVLPILERLVDRSVAAHRPRVGA